jgi:hypothetical protein
MWIAFYVTVALMGIFIVYQTRIQPYPVPMMDNSTGSTTQQMK